VRPKAQYNLTRRYISQEHFPVKYIASGSVVPRTCPQRGGGPVLTARAQILILNYSPFRIIIKDHQYFRNGFLCADKGEEKGTLK